MTDAKTHRRVVDLGVVATSAALLAAAFVEIDDVDATRRPPVSANVGPFDRPLIGVESSPEVGAAPTSSVLSKSGEAPPLELVRAPKRSRRAAARRRSRAS